MEKPTSSEVIYSDTVDESQDPFVLVDSEKPGDDNEEEDKDDDDDSGEDSRSRYTYAVWKQAVPLGRPRMRLQGPTAVFTATASLKPADAIDPASSSGYLPSGVPSGLNLLEAFGDDPAMHGIKPRLSALRVSRVAPVTQQAKDLLRPIRSLPRLSLRIFPAAHSRIRFSRPNGAAEPNSPAILAMLEVDFTPFFECEVLLDGIELAVRGGGRGGVVDDLTRLQTGLALPLSCVAHDHVTFLYRIAPAEEDTISKYPTRELDIAISATALAEPGVCEPRLSMAWVATVDFTLPLNPGYGSALQPIQRSHRPSQLSISVSGADAATTSLTAPAVSRPDSIPSLEATARAAATEASLPELGITITFTAPPASHKIYPGDTFTWTAFVVNRGPPSSSEPSANPANPSHPAAAPRKLALVAIPRRRRAESGRINRPPSVAASQPYNTNSHHIHSHSHPHSHHHHSTHARDRAVADAVLDESVVHAMQRGSGLEEAPVASLSADARVGPLAPGSCHAVDLRFLALRPGVHSLDAVRVVDVGSNEHVDVRELPVVVVESRQDR